MVDTREWTPYGVEVGETQDGLGYAGEWWDSHVEFQYLRARWYAVSLGQFTSSDPVEDNHPYQYADANPVTFTDPSGRDVGCPGGDASGCGSPTSWMYDAAVTACRDNGMPGGCYLRDAAQWYLYFTGSAQAAQEYIAGTGMAAGETGSYRTALAREWAGYAYGKDWITSSQNLRFWPTPQQPAPEMAAFVMMSFSGPELAKLSADLTCQVSFPAADLGEDVYPTPGLPEAGSSTYNVAIPPGQWKWLGPDRPPTWGDELAELADDVYRNIEYWPRRNSTVAVSRVDDQVYVAYAGDSRAGGALARIAEAKGYHYLPNITGEHAEIYMYNHLYGKPGFLGIGVSHSRGPCESCRSFFTGIDFTNVFWTGLYK